MRFLIWMFMQSAFNLCVYPKKVLIIFTYVQHLFWQNLFGLVCTNSRNIKYQYRMLLRQSCTWDSFICVNLIPSDFFPHMCKFSHQNLWQCNPIKVLKRIKKHLLSIHHRLANGINVPRVTHLSVVAYGAESVPPLTLWQRLKLL